MGEHAGIVAACAGEADAQAEAGEALGDINRAADALETELSKMTEHIATTEARRASLQRQARMAREQVERLTRQMSALEDDRQRLTETAAGAGEVEAAEQAVTDAEARWKRRVRRLKTPNQPVKPHRRQKVWPAISCSRLTLDWQS